MRAQIRYIRYSKAVHILIVRTGLFTLCSSALLSLLPLLAKHELGLDSIGFGLLLGSFGMGAVIGGIAILPKLRSMVSAESLISCSIVLLALVMFLVGFVPNFSITLYNYVARWNGIHYNIIRILYHWNEICPKMDWISGFSSLSS